MNERKKQHKDQVDEADARLETVAEQITDFGACPAENRCERFQCISIIGQIEGHYVLPEGQKATK